MLLGRLAADPCDRSTARALAARGLAGLSGLTPADLREEIVLSQMRAGLGDPDAAERLLELLGSAEPQRAALALVSLGSRLSGTQRSRLLAAGVLGPAQRERVVSSLADDPEELLPLLDDPELGDLAGALATRAAAQEYDLGLLERLAEHPGRSWRITALRGLAWWLPPAEAVRVVGRDDLEPAERDLTVRSLLERQDLPQAALFDYLHRERLATEETLVEAASSADVPTVTLLGLHDNENLPQEVRDAATVSLLERAGGPPPSSRRR